MFSLIENAKIIPVMRPIDKTGAGRLRAHQNIAAHRMREPDPGARQSLDRIQSDKPLQIVNERRKIFDMSLARIGKLAPG